MEQEKERVRITNRHIAKILSRLSQIQLPDIVKDEIKRQMWFLSDDLWEMCRKGECEINDKPRK